MNALIRVRFGRPVALRWLSVLLVLPFLAAIIAVLQAAWWIALAAIALLMGFASAIAATERLLVRR